MSKRDMWRKTVDEQLKIKPEEQKSVKRIVSRLLGKEDLRDQQDQSNPLQDHPIDQISDQLIEKTTQNIPVQNLDPSNNYTGIEIRPVQLSTVPKIIPVQNLDPSTEKKSGYLKLPNEILDNLLPSLSPSEAVVFLRLYRLSLGFNNDCCTVGITSLLSACNISEQTCRTAIRRLIALGHIKQIAILNTKEVKGTTYQICTGLISIPVQNLDGSNNYTGINFIPNKDHDHDDLLKTDHHQNAHARATMTLYQKLTGNPWTKADDKSYDKIKHLSVEQIAITLRAVLSRATQKPASLAYFVKEILNPTQANPANREALKRKYKAFLSEIREIHVGGRVADIVGALKDRLVSEGIAIDHDLINQTLNSLK